MKRSSQSSLFPAHRSYTRLASYAEDGSSADNGSVQSVARQTVVALRKAALVSLVSLSSLFGLTGAVFAEQPSDVEGLWATGGSLVEVMREGDTLKMIVVALEEPFDESGAAFLDTNNPDEDLRSQPIQGMNLLANYRFTGKRWEGKIYDPESGSVYSSRMQKKKDVLEMRGYIGTPLLGKTKKFKPITECRPDMLVMLKNGNITGYCGL